MQLSCCVQKMLSPCSHPLPLVLPSFLLLFLSDLGRRVCDGNVPPEGYCATASPSLKYSAAPWTGNDKIVFPVLENFLKMEKIHLNVWSELKLTFFFVSLMSILKLAFEN